MNSDEFKGMWNQLKGHAKEKWGEITDDDLKKIEGRKDKLVGFLQEKYGYSKDQAESAVNEWGSELSKLKK